MKCSNCGAEIKDGAAFCPKCGTKQSVQSVQITQSTQTMQTAQNAQTSQSAQIPQEKKSKLSGGAIAGIGMAAVAVVAVIAAAVILLPKGGISLPTGGKADAPGSKGAGSAASETPLYAIEDVAVIDLSARNYTPGTKEPGMKWDSELFYWLEDADTLTDEDGNIANCNVSKTLLRNAQTGELCQYEIYSDPEDGSVYKIVSISSDGAVLELVDYYYKDGQPNFMFKREDTVYTPTYATIGKVGERYYFDRDVMVRWRMIRVPNEIGEYTLSKGDVWYSQVDYFAESDEIQGIYDETEFNALNTAHNVYDAVTGNANIGVVQGRLRDTAGNGVAQKKIKLYRAEDNVLLYEAQTDESGNFSFFVYLDGSVCNLQIGADGQYRELKLSGVELSPASAIYAYDLTAHREGGDKYPVSIRLYSAADMVSDAEGNINADTLGQAAAVVREGGRNYSGETLERVEAPNGEIALNLPSGIYTVQLQAEGYLDTYLEVEVMEGETSRDAYLMTTLAENQTGVILTWDGEASDLDLTLFTPYQGADGDMAHIGGAVREDGHGNILISDNGSRCEAMYLNTGEKGSYKLYVNSYTDSVAGNYSSASLSASNVHIYVYNSNGFVADYALPSGQNGVVWEVAEISGSAITPAQRVYAEISGKSWWMEEKGKKQLVKRITITNADSHVYMYRTDYEYDGRGKLARETNFYMGSEYGEEECYRLREEGFLEGGMGEAGTEYSYQYDGSGNLIEETREYSYANYNAIHVSRYDSQGNLVSWSYSTDDRDGNEYADYEYDAQGNLIREVRYIREGEAEFPTWSETIYNNQGKCVKVSWDYDSDGSVDEWIDYEYDIYGNLIKATEYPGGRTRSWIDYSYDAQGNLIEETFFNGTDETAKGWIDYEYDTQGNQIKETTYNYKGEENWRWIYEYDAQGNLTGEREYYRYALNSDEPVQYGEYEYNAQGRLIRKVWHGDDGSGMAYEWYEALYDDQGKLMKRTDYWNGETGNDDKRVCYWTDYNYDAWGNLIKETTYREEGSVLRWTDYIYE